MARVRTILLAGSIVLASSLYSPADLFWGPNGAGGSGSWSASNANWFNGSSQVTWPTAGDSAVFGGTAGNVSVDTSFLLVSHLTFNTPGYVLGGNSSLEAVDAGLIITTNADATITAN